MIRLIFLALGVALLGACAPSTSIRAPLTASPPASPAAPPPNGAIFRAGVNDRPLFEDRRARHVGDLLTIVIAESTSATGKSDSSLENSGSASLQSQLVVPGGYSGSSSVNSSSKNDASGTNTFNGTLTATVTEEIGRAHV